MVELPTTVLGHTGLVVTRLGIGGAYAKSADDYRAALDTGVTYVDTARNYADGEDERRIGEALVGYRDRITLATKTIKRDAAGARADLESSLRLLRTDYIDIWQLHYLNTDADRAQALGPGGALEAALAARDEGLVRFIGVTGHDWAQVALAVQTGAFDTVLCWYNCAMPEPETLLFPHTMAQRMGVVIMQTTRVDKLLSPDDNPPPETFYRYVLSHPAVSVALMGLRDLDRFRRVAAALAERATMVPGEKEWLEAYGRELRAAGKLD